MAGLVISDASPIVGLARASGLGWLVPLFNEVGVSEQVKAELLSGRVTADQPRIRIALKTGSLKIWPNPIAPALRRVGKN